MLCSHVQRRSDWKQFIVNKSYRLPVTRETDVGVSSYATKVELYVNTEGLGAETTNGNEDSDCHVIHDKEHTLLLLHLVSYNADKHC